LRANPAFSARGLVGRRHLGIHVVARLAHVGAAAGQVQRPKTQMASMDFTPTAGLLSVTWMIWLAGGGGLWMQAPKYGTAGIPAAPSSPSSGTT
jgi:hypothetical protein